MLADELNLKRETVRKILTDDLSMKKLCANMVPKNLLAEQKHVQMSISQDCLEQVEADPTLLDRVITGDESWYFQYDPETKRQSQQWLSPGAARPKKARMSKSNLRSSSNEYVCDQSRPCTSNEQYLDTNDTLVISGMSNDVCDSALVEKTVINADKNETHNNKCKYYRYIGDFLEEDLETPRRRKLFWNTHTKMLDEKNQKKRLLEQKNRRLESKISSLNTLVDELKKECQLNASYSHILKNIGTEEEKQLLMRQLQISTGKSICPILRKFAMTLHFYSPSAYSYVRTIFSKALPDVSTIRKWYSKLDGLPGMTKESFQAISLKVKEMKVNGKQLYGCLVMDEMSIKQHVHWTGTRHQGYIDFGLGGKTEEMDNLPYAKDAFVIMVVDINTSWKVPIAYYLINGISAEEKANIILNCLQELDTTGVIIKTLTFDGAANNFSMASELEANLQYSENCLGDWKILYTANGETIKWSYFKNLVNLQNESGLHSATKLRNRHIYYFREKMKVRLAVQTFSTSVANAILFCMNDLKLDNFQEYLSFILTYKFSQDHIEMLFSAIRAKGGFNNNPTVSQFEAAYKSIIVHSEIKSSSSANCMALDDTTILTVSSSNIKVKDTQSELLDLLCVAGTDDLENDNLLSVYQHSNFINDVVACIAGFVVRKIKKKTILCDTCAVEIEVGSSESKLLDRKNRGGLIKPSHDVVQIFQTSNPEAYRTLVHYLRNEKAEFHTFQLKEDKPMRIVIRNLHPSTSTEMIKNELEHRLYEVRQVTQVISKIPLPLFFVDLEPTDHSKEIFKLESILHTKIKIEESHKPKIISQCQNCQAYGHTKAYCGYSPRCVRCGDDHSSSACPNSRQDPMRCALCREDNTPILKPEVIMPPVALSFDTAINLVPKFNGECAQEVYPFLSTCDFVIKSVSEDCRPILLQAILTKLAGKAYAATQHREVKSWETLRGLLEVTFCAKRTPGYLQLELTTTKHKAGETVQEYSSRVEALLHELCNVSAAKRSPTDAKAVHEYIKETTLTTYVEGLPFSIRGVIKSKNHTSLEEAIKDSLEEDRIYQSNKGTQRLLHNKSNNNSSNKYCKNCQKTNHNTSECKYTNRTVDTGQQSKQNKDKTIDNKRTTCGYCKKTGHTLEECYKKKNADARKGNENKNNQPSTSGNGKEPGKAGVRLDDVQVSDKKIYNMQGINDKLVSTLGSTVLTVSMDNETYETEFQVVDSTFPIVGDGILGNPFLKANRIIIDVGKEELSTRNENSNVIPARSELIIPVDVNTNESSTHNVLIHAQELNKNILCGNVLNIIKNQQVLISVMNPTEEPQEILTPKLTDLSHEILDTVSMNNMRTVEKCSNPENRIQILKDSLRCDHMNNEEKTTIQELCSEYADIFFLEGDTINCTEAVQHEIKIPSGTQPIYQKPYRLPYAQKKEINEQIKQLEQNEIIVPSESPWNAPLLIVPKKMDASGNKKYRVVVDFRKLNNITVGDAFPMPDITSILDQLGKAKYFSCLDLASGYHQIGIHPRYMEKTAFSTSEGHYEFKRMCFGLKGAPATFQRLMNRVLNGINGSRAFVYLDDIIVIGATLQEHTTRLREVFERLRQYNLQLQPPKCEFLRKEVNYLGHVITENGVKPDPKKIECIVNYPVPDNTKKIKSFLGLIGYYRKFIKDFSKKAKPLTNLLKQNQPFIWSDSCEDSFLFFKNILTNEPILQHPDFDRPFIVTTDASNTAIGAILSQGKVGTDLPITYASRTLNKAEKNYNTTEKELLAIVWAVKQFRPYLYGRKFTVVTDHKPLTWLFGVKDPGARLVRWRLQLEEFDYNVIYKPGTQNTNSDALSRISKVNASLYSNDYKQKSYQQFIEEVQTKLITNPNVIEVQGDLFETSKDIALGHCVSKDFKMSQGIALEFRRKFGQIENLTNQNKEVTEIASIQHNDQNILYIITKNHHQEKPTYETFYQAIKNLRTFCEENQIEKLALPKIGSGHDQLNWDQVRTILRYVFKKSKIKLIIYVDTTYSEQEKQNIIKEFHLTPLGGHQGISKTVKRIKLHHSWKGLKNDVIEYVKKCTSCQMNKSSNHSIQQPMVVTTTASKPFEKIFLDIVGPIDTSLEGNAYILTIQDDLTKFSVAIPLPNHTANTIAKAFVEKFVCLHGIPDSILTDQGPDFLSKIFQACCKLLQIETFKTTAYHPQSNGALERSHRTLTEYLRHFVSEQKQNWDQYIAYAMFVYNSSIHATTGYQPYELVYGRQVEVPHSLSRNPQPCYNYDDYNFELRKKLQESHKLARDKIIKTKEKAKTNYDKNERSININVGDKVLTKDHTQKGKLSPKWKGPFEVINIHDNQNVSIQRGNKEVKIHKNELKIFSE
ncbi:hypothetical protein QTP88_000066 [Uroleucon formosanum]